MQDQVNAFPDRYALYLNIENEKIIPGVNDFENGCFMADCDAVLDIRRDMEQTLEQCREVTEKYKSGRSATLRLGQLFLRLFAELL